MLKLIIKQENIYFIDKDYLIDPELKMIHSLRNNKKLKGCKHGSKYLYFTIKGERFNINTLIKWSIESEGKQLIEKPIDKLIKECLSCKEETTDFVSIKSKFCNKCILKIKTPDFTNEYKIVDNFLYKLKSKNWVADWEELFELINAFDIYFPTVTISNFNEDAANKLLIKIINKHKKMRIELIKKI